MNSNPASRSYAIQRLAGRPQLFAFYFIRKKPVNSRFPCTGASTTVEAGKENCRLAGAARRWQPVASQLRRARPARGRRDETCFRPRL
jgi:hypothetical protein